MDMKRYLILLLILSSAFNLNAQRLAWPLGEVSVEKLDQRIFTYHMFDTTGVKVGSMVTQLIVKDDHIIFIDTSQFDNGSVYEDARLVFSKDPIRTRKTNIAIKTPSSVLDFHFDLNAPLQSKEFY